LTKNRKKGCALLASGGHRQAAANNNQLKLVDMIEGRCWRIGMVHDGICGGCSYHTDLGIDIKTLKHEMKIKVALATQK
jgi:hypothetical protein